MLRPEAMFLATIVLLQCGCGSRDFRTPDDHLRARVQKLERANRDLEHRNQELLAQLSAVSEGPGGPVVEHHEAIPHVTSIAVGRLSHVRDTDGDGRGDELVAYLTPADGRGRFVQMAGTVTLQAVMLPPDGDPVTVGRVNVDPLALRGAWRSGLTGGHYTIRCPLQLPEQPTTRITVSVRYDDLRTGRQFTADRGIDAVVR